MSFAYEIESKEVPDDVKFGGVVKVQCEDCDKPLILILITRPDEDSIHKVKSNCCYCEGNSAVIEINGGFTYSGFYHDTPNGQVVETKVEDIIFSEDIQRFVVKQARKEYYYNEKGDKTLAPKDAVAKKITDPSSDKNIFYLKFANSGINRGHLYNPCGIFSSEYEISAHNKLLDNERYQWKKVPEQSFMQYLKFLQNRNVAHYHAAERLYKDEAVVR